MDTDQQDHGVSPTFSTAEKKRTHQECEVGYEPHQSSNGLLQHRPHSKDTDKRLRRKQRNTRAKLQKSNACGEVDEEKIGIEKRIMLLQSIIPGGESLGIDKLFEETALYILALQGQVKTMKILTSLFESLQKEKSESMFGG